MQQIENDKILIERILADLGDDFTPAAFNQKLKEAKAKEPKPDLIYEMEDDASE